MGDFSKIRIIHKTKLLVQLQSKHDIGKWPSATNFITKIQLVIVFQIRTHVSSGASLQTVPVVERKDRLIAFRVTPPRLGNKMKNQTQMEK